ncbi:MAG: 1-(5-phosphoribosyl)-5-((5-phosphoribosylamino)methylideneamino)imidazole-4-carboxamide isomerase, partial [Clostridia bacterium]|nr:1-(5-phosphoribosyl)-5-((5-phosphoribosylamino)methylideneamino)imidazole-4-carboxamide isomerase [Clostridia bacterium]
MMIFPAVDLIGGKAVRLKQGDYGKMTVFGDDPVAAAKKFETEGAKYLHVVDLDGAKDGGRPNEEVIKSIINETRLNVEVGGGVRDEVSVRTYLDAGAFRVILGT